MKAFFFLFSLSIPYPTFRPGDPQSAQDKARMDKEYLSLMAELGEAPVPASVGSTSGPATTPLASAPRPAAPANNPPPPVSFRGWFLWPGPPFSSSETGALWPGALGRAGWRTWLATLFFRTSGCLGISRFGKIPSSGSGPLDRAERTVLPPGGAGRDVGGKCSHVVSHVHHPEPPTLDEFGPFRESALPRHARRWSWWARRWPPQLPTPVTQPDRWARWTSHAAQP